MIIFRAATYRVCWIAANYSGSETIAVHTRLEDPDEALEKIAAARLKRRIAKSLGLKTSDVQVTDVHFVSLEEEDDYYFED